jgi:hypothetical protein
VNAVRQTWWRTAQALREKFSEWQDKPIMLDQKGYGATPSGTLTVKLLSAEATSILRRMSSELWTSGEVNGWRIECDSDRLLTDGRLTLYALSPTGQRHCIATLAGMVKP